MAEFTTRDLANTEIFGEPYEFNGYNYETDIINITTNTNHYWYGADFHNFIVDPVTYSATHKYSGYYNYSMGANKNITFMFKKYAIKPKQLVINTGISGNVKAWNSYVYYLINGEWVQKYQLSVGNQVIDLEPIETEGIMVTLYATPTKANYAYSQFNDIALTYEAMMASKIIKSKVKDVILNNEKIQKCFPFADISNPEEEISTTDIEYNVLGPDYDPYEIIDYSHLKDLDPELPDSNIIPTKEEVQALFKE